MPAPSPLAAGPHSGTRFDIIAGIGVAILVIVGTTVRWTGSRFCRRGTGLVKALLTPTTGLRLP
ncbi:hypothetical protein ABZ770_06215 [Streptomyces sp. NPDC006654]|uniref:hypothetical protein n=1 Tax=unclassified Streptomyces TaxID=2593676 RepID=UPI0033F96ACC